MTDLRVQLRASVDSVPRVTLEEVLDRAPLSSRPRRTGTGSGVAVAAALGAFLVLAVIAGYTRSNPAHTTTSTQTATAAEPRPARGECIVSATNRNGCDVTSGQAQALLGYPVPGPQTLPNGWVQLQQTVRIYRPGTSDNPGGAEIRMAHAIWGPPRTDVAAPDAQWVRLDVRAATAADLAGNQQPLLVTLPDGTTISGFSGPSSYVDPASGGGVHLRMNATWVRAGLWYRYESQGRSSDQDLTLIRSIR
jgi:hypothetical protein